MILPGTLLHGNQFASGGLLLMAIGAIGASLRKIPNKLWDSILHQFTLSLTMTDESQALTWFRWWFQQHKRSSRIRHLDVFTPFPEIALLQPAPRKPLVFFSWKTAANVFYAN